MTAALILAGGRGRRLGGVDKALLALGGRPLLAHVKERLAPQVTSLTLSANGDPARFAGFGLPVVADALPDFAGPLAGLLAGMEWIAAAHPHCRYVLSASVDCPFLPPDLAARLTRALGRKEACAIAASKGRIHPTIGLWHLDLRGDLAGFLQGGGRRLVEWTRLARAITVDFPTAALDPFFNINSPDDLAEAESLLADRVCLAMLGDSKEQKQAR